MPENPPGLEAAIQVLVVEDDESVRQMLGLALRKYGLGVALAASGPEAVENFRQNHQTIDLVLLDVHLAGMDGPATLAALKKIKAPIACCFMSGNLGTYSEKDLLELGAACVLQKPFPSMKLLARQLKKVFYGFKNKK